MYSALAISQQQHPHFCEGVQSVKLELEVMGSSGSKCNVVSVFRVENFGSLQGCHYPMVWRS